MSGLRETIRLGEELASSVAAVDVPQLSQGERLRLARLVHRLGYQISALSERLVRETAPRAVAGLH